MGMKRPGLLLALILALNVLTLSPVLECGYTGDDLLNSLMPGFLAETGTSAWGQLSAEIRTWAAHGRFYPLAFYYIFLFSAVRSLLGYRLVQLGMAVLNLLLFARLLTALSGSRRLGLLAALIPAALFQLRMGPDPILGFHCLSEVVLAFLLSSLLCLDAYLRTERRRFFVLSVLLYLLGLLTYDITYPFFLLHGALIYFRTAGRKPTASLAWRLAPFFLLSVAFVMVCVGLRVHHGVGLPGASQPGADVYAESPNVRGWPVTLAKETLAAAPLSYLALFLAPRGWVTAGDLLSQYAAASVALSALGGFALVRALLRSPVEPLPGASGAPGNGLGPRPLFVFGGLLTLLPGVLMSLAPKYQRELDWGLGYIPVYLSYFGVATVLVAGCQAALRLYPSRRRLYGGLVTAGAVLFAATLAVNGAANRSVAGILNGFDYYPRSLLENGLKHGLLWAVPDGSRLVVADRPNYFVPGGYGYFFRNYAGRHLNVAAQGSYPAEGPAGPVYYLRYGASSAAAGYAILGKCDRLAATAAEVRSAPSGQAYLYVQVPDLWRRFSLGGRWLAKDGTAEPFVLSDRQLGLLGQGRTWRLYRLPCGERQADLASLTVDLERGR